MTPVQVATGQEVSLIFAVAVAPGQREGATADLAASAVASMLGEKSLERFADSKLESRVLYASEDGVVSPLSLIVGTKPGTVTRTLIDDATKAMSEAHPGVLVVQVSGVLTNGGTRPITLYPAWFGRDRRVMLVAVGKPQPRSVVLSPEGPKGLAKYLREAAFADFIASNMSGLTGTIEAVAAIPSDAFAAIADVSKAVSAAAKEVQKNAGWGAAGLFALGIGWLGIQAWKARRRR
jgi:hypothetical protein